MPEESIFHYMMQLSMIWVVPALTLTIMLMGSVAAVLWMFRERRPKNTEPPISWIPCPWCGSSGCNYCNGWGVIAVYTEQKHKDTTT